MQQLSLSVFIYMDGIVPKYDLEPFKLIQYCTYGS